MKKIILFIFLSHFSYCLFSQCTNGTENSSIASTNDGNVQILSSNVETFEYVTVTNIIPGDQYVFTNYHIDNGTIVHEYITIRNASNVLIASGFSPLTTSAISVSTIRISISVDATCNGDLFFHTVTNVNLSKVTCNKPESPGISYKSNTRIDFYWSAPAYSTPVDYYWEIVPSGNAQGVGVIVSGSTGGATNASSGNVLSGNTSYSIYVRSNCDANGNSTYLGPLNFATNTNAPPANDFCSGAITLIEQTSIPNAASATSTSGTLLGGAGTDVNAESCGGNTGNARDDVWYKFVAQTTNAHITVEPSPNFDVVVTLYSGDCNTLSYLDCSDVNVSSPSSEEIYYSGLTIGNTYYTRTYYYGTATPASPTFNIKIWTTGTANDADGDGYITSVDCDDNNPSINPGATEVAGNDVDENCDGNYLRYVDNDGDGYGSTSTVSSSSATPGTNESNNSTDCNDSNASINPGATDIVANGIDENCDGMFQWYQDNDLDGYGSTTVVQSSNASPATGESNNSMDCDDGNASIHPGVTDIVANGIDENCDGMFQWYQDSDGDGYGSTTVVQSSNASPGAGESNNSTDCDDTRSGVNPGASEIEGNGLDDDCNPSTPDMPLGVEEFDLNNVRIVPNPFIEKITIYLSIEYRNDKFDTYIYDLNGRTIFELSTVGNNGIISVDNLDVLQQGLYFIKISRKADGKSIVRQLIKY